MIFYVPIKNKLFEGISLSPSIDANRITDLAANEEKQLIEKKKDFVAFSIALDESTAVSDSAQYIVFINV